MSYLVPTALAASSADVLGNTLGPIIKNIINPALEVLFAVALVIFVWSVVRLIAGGDASEEARTKAKWTFLGALIGMFLMVSAWGIINIVSNTVKGF